MRIRSQLLILLVASIFITTSLVGGVLIYTVYNQTRNNMEISMENQADQFAHQVDRWFNEVKQDGLFFVSQPHVQSATPVEMQRLLGIMHNTMNVYDSLLVVTPGGTITGIYPPYPEVINSSIGDHPCFEETVATKLPQFGKVKADEFTGKMVFVITHPIVNYKGQLTAVLVQNVKLDVLQAMAADVKMGKSGRTIVFSNEGQPIVPREAIPGPVLELYRKDLRYVEQFTDSQGQEILATVSRVITPNWGIAVTATSSEVLQAFYTSVKNGIWTFCVIFVALAFAVLAVFSRLFRSITVVTERFSLMNQGNFASARIDDDVIGSAPQELRQLCLTFNDMAATINNNIDTLNSVNAALRSSEERWQLALRGSNDAIFDYNIKTGEVFFSAQAMKGGFHGGDSQINVEEVKESLHPDDFDMVMQQVSNHFLHKTPFLYAECRYRRVDGVYGWVLIRGQAVWDDQGDPVRMVGSIGDISRRKKAEQALQEAHDELEIKVELRTQELMSMNEELHSMNEELHSMNEELQAINEELSQSNKDLENQIARRKRVEDSLAGTNRELIKTLEELKRTQAYLVQSEKMASLGNLVAGVAHEINTPVGVGVTAASHLEMITGNFTRLYAEGNLKRQDMEEYLADTGEAVKIILANLERAARLIKSFKQVSVDQSSEARRVFNVKQYIDGIILSLNPRLKKTKHTVTIRSDEDLEIDGFPGSFSQIVTNLVINSLMHAYGPEDEGNIVIDAAKAGEQLLLTYSDDGKGMDREVLAQIFEPFFTTKRGEGASGLGLHILYNIMTQQFGGTVECRSEPGKGSTFIMTFPIKKEKRNDSKQ